MTQLEATGHMTDQQESVRCFDRTSFVSLLPRNFLIFNSYRNVKDVKIEDEENKLRLKLCQAQVQLMIR